MKALRIFLSLLAVVLAACLCLHFFGHHNIPLSRSWILEKQIRELHYFETHESVDYARAHERYRELRSKIIFADTGECFHEKYAKAEKRAFLKARIIELIRQYRKNKDAKYLREALSIYEGEEMENASYYRLGGPYIRHDGAKIDKTWFLNEMKKVEQGDSAEPSSAGAPEVR